MEDLHELLLDHPSIEVLTLDDCGNHVALPRLLAQGMIREDESHIDSSPPQTPGGLLPNLKSLVFTGYIGRSAGNKRLGLYVSQLMEMREELHVITARSSFSTSQVGLQQLKAWMGERLQVISP